MNKPVYASIIKFLKNEESLLIKIVIHINHDESIDSNTEQCFNIIRNYHDLKKLSRLSNLSQVEYFPSKTFRKLFNYETSWINNCPTQTPFILRRSISASEKWLNLILISCDLQTLNEIVDNDLYRLQKNSIAIRKQIEKRPRQLQQYFASSNNIEILMQYALIEHNNSGGGGGGNNILSSSNENIVYIEPSCGDGRIMKKLVESGAQNIIGIDIDPEISEKAKNSMNNIITDSFPHSKVNFYVQDFLVTKRKDLLVPYSSSSSSSIENHQIIVIGGPPFSIIPTTTIDTTTTNIDTTSTNIDTTTTNIDTTTTNIDTTTTNIIPTTTTIDTTTTTNTEIHIANMNEKSSFDYSSSQRCDYPLLFLIHSAIELEAIRIIFILPERCNSLAFIQQATNLMKDETNQTTWRIVHSIKADSSFTLLDREIKQPAIIQVWERN